MDERHENDARGMTVGRSGFVLQMSWHVKSTRKYCVVMEIYMHISSTASSEIR